MIHAAEQDRPDVAEHRDRWRVEQLGLDPAKLVFIDETWAKTNMTRLRGRAPRGQHLIEKVPHGHWKTTTLIAALDDQGMRCATTVDGAVNGDVFTAFVEQVLVPTLKRGDKVITDNSRRTKCPACVKRSRLLGRRWFTCRHTRRTSIRSSWPSAN